MSIKEEYYILLREINNGVYYDDIKSADFLEEFLRKIKVNNKYYILFRVQHSYKQSYGLEKMEPETLIHKDSFLVYWIKEEKMGDSLFICIPSSPQLLRHDDLFFTSFKDQFI